MIEARATRRTGGAAMPSAVIRFASLALLVAGPAFALDDPKTSLVDPYDSGMLDWRQITILGDPERIALDARVRVSAPASAEDSAHAPVLVDARGIEDVARIVVFVDYGPIPEILEFRPGDAEPFLEFRFKIDQSTPVRAAVQTTDGAWLLGSTWIDAAGGGCTAPAAAYASDDWEERLGEARGRLWPQSGRVRVSVDHPMDTGLVDGVPVFIIESLALSDAEGRERASLTLYEPVEEDPRFTFQFADGALTGPLRLTGRDNNGNLIDAEIPFAGLSQ
jgi:sulfur-oxidizing protein SoxY